MAINGDKVWCKYKHQRIGLFKIHPACDDYPDECHICSNNKYEEQSTKSKKTTYFTPQGFVKR